MYEGEQECKGCTGTVMVTDEEIKKIFGDMVKVKKVKLVSEEVYKDRISKCLSCESLDYGTTCRFCGCLVQIKAKLAAAKCPCPGNPRW